MEIHITREIHVERKLFKPQPELRKIVDADVRLSSGCVRVSFADEGSGTKVTVHAPAWSGLREVDLDSILDRLAGAPRRAATAA